MALDSYPPVGFHFKVEFDLSGIGEQDFLFRDVSGISMQLEEETLSEGGENRFSHKFPGRASYDNLVLKRGLLVDSTLRKWCEDAIYNLSIEPTTVWVTVLNDQHEPLQVYTFVNAWPKKWNISDLNAMSSDIIIESLELAYQYFKIA